MCMYIYNMCLHIYIYIYIDNYKEMYWNHYWKLHPTIGVAANWGYFGEFRHGPPWRDQPSRSMICSLVVDLPLWKIMDFVIWDDDIPNWMGSHKIPWFQSTYQRCHVTTLKHRNWNYLMFDHHFPHQMLRWLIIFRSNGPTLVTIPKSNPAGPNFGDVNCMGLPLVIIHWWFFPWKSTIQLLG